MLFLKLTLAPLLIALVSLAGQRFGQRTAGLLAGFPIIAGPIFIVLTLEQGTQFGYHAAGATLAGLVSFSAYALTYAWLARRWNWLISLMVGWLAFALVSRLLLGFETTLTADIGLAAVSQLLAYRLLPKPTTLETAMKLPHSEILLRMIAGAALVLAVTSIAQSAGPRVAGLLTPFPVAGSVLAACSHRAGGADAVARLLRGMVGGLASLTAFFAVTAWLLTGMGLWPAAAVGLIIAIAIQLLLLILHQPAEAAE